MTLEELLADLNSRGELNSISLSVSSGGFNASYTPASKYGVYFGHDADPVKAIKKAVDQVKLARKTRVAVSKPNANEFDEVEIVSSAEMNRIEDEAIEHFTAAKKRKPKKSDIDFG